MSFDPPEIERLREVYNREKGGSIPAGDPHKVWKALQAKFHEECRTGAASCIITNMMHKPAAPDSWSVNRYEWLSSDDIAAIEKQYTKLFEGYEFLGCIPIDFDLKDEVGKCIVESCFGVELGKAMAKAMDSEGGDRFDASTEALLAAAGIDR